jgi:hypothetical protein
MKIAGGCIVALLLAGAVFAQQAPKLQTQLPAEAGSDARECANERKRIAALSDLNVGYREKIDLLEQKIKTLEKRK